jgi:hypothetical protein
MVGRHWSVALGLVGALAAGCGGDPGEDYSDIELIGRDWTIPPGEHYKCLGIEVERDLYISGFRNDNPLGEHHTVLTVADQLGGLGGTQLGEYDCEVLTVDLEMLYASGVGEGSLDLPEGVALKVEAGQFLHLNLHLFNTTAGDLSGRSTITASLIPPVPAELEAEMVFTGTFAIDIPPGETMTTGGGCTFQEDATLFAYWPHMHQYATHQTVTLDVGGESRVLHDEAYDFEHQINYPLDPTIDVTAGDSIRVDCTYTNFSTETLTWGDSSTEEMCFTGLYRYPKQAFSLFDCTAGAQP